MRFLLIVLLLSFLSSVFADDREALLKKYKEDHPEWSTLPNPEYLKFYTEWANESLKEDISQRENLSEKEKSALEAQRRVAIRVLELRNEYAQKITDVKEQKKVIEELDRAADISLCTNHEKNCEELSKKDQKLVLYLRARDAHLAGMESEFTAQVPDWKERKGNDKVKDFKIRKEEKSLELTLKLSQDMCLEFPKDTEHCLAESDVESLRGDSQRESCLIQRVHQLYNLSKDDNEDKEKILMAGHKSQWDALKTKNCQNLLKLDRLGENLSPPKVEVKEEVFGENQDEKDPQNFDPETCKWVNEIPRRVTYIPGCSNKAACNGYVVCNQKKGGGKFVRLSTCGPNLCGGTDKDAVACTKQPGYYSKKAKGETKEFVSEKLKRILSGVTKQ